MLAPGLFAARRARVRQSALAASLGALVVSSSPLATAAPGDTVEMSGERFTEVDAAAEGPQTPAPGPAVASRELTLSPVEGGFELAGTYEIDAAAPGLLSGVVAGPGTRIEDADLGGRIAPILRTPAGTVFAAWIEGPTTLKIRGFVDARPDALQLTTLDAARGRLRLDGDPRVLRWPTSVDEAPSGLAIVDGDIVGGSGSISARLIEPGAAAPAGGPLVMGHAGVGLTVGDAEARVHARLRWDVRRGALTQVRAKITGAQSDLQLVGPAVERWTREGDELHVILAGETTDRVDIDLTWTQPLGQRAESTVDLPRVEPLGVFRADGTLQLSRDGELEVVPHVDGWTAVAAADLPGWGQGLVEGKTTAAFKTARAGRAGKLDLLRFVPVPGPPTVVDVADYEIATTEAGRVLLKARYEVRNERASHLRIEAPKGLTIIGARVEQDTARPAKDDTGAWRIPLKRSLETVGGSLSFPVEVVMLGEGQAWSRRERRELALPTLDAPIAASRATLYLPPQYRTKLSPGDGTLVEAFTEGEGITYGLGLGTTAAGGQVAQADAIFQEAVDAYRNNDFDQAQARLDDLGRMGARNDKVANLQGNLDLLDEKDEGVSNGAGGGGKGDVVLERRIKEQAKARAAGEIRRQQELAEEAEQAQLAGDYARAEQKLDEALVLGDKLAKLEQRESVEQEVVNVRLASKRGSIVRKAKRKAARKNRWVRGRRFGGLAGSSAASGSDTADVATPARASDPTPTTEGARPPSPALPAAPPADGAETTDPTSVADRQAGYAGGELFFEDEDDDEEAESERPRRFARARVGFRGDRRRRAKRSQRPFKSAAPATTVDDFDDDALDGAVLQPEGANIDAPAPVPDPNAPLAAPKATATGMSVVVPATGPPQYYQQLLLEAGRTQTLRIDARKHRRSTRR